MLGKLRPGRDRSLPPVGVGKAFMEESVRAAFGEWQDFGGRNRREGTLGFLKGSLRKRHRRGKCWFIEGLGSGSLEKILHGQARRGSVLKIIQKSTRALSHRQRVVSVPIGKGTWPERSPGKMSVASSGAA